MPKTEPWNAPEHHYRGFTFAECIKMDIFSFGAFCLWLLFYNVGQTQGEDFSGDMEDADSNTFANRARERVLIGTPATSHSQIGLLKFFESSLAPDPKLRASSIAALLEILEESW